jgi:hypothetical protein
MTKTKHKGPRAVPGLQHLLSYRRSHNSVGEKQYIHDHITPLKPQVIATKDGEVMAFIVYVGKSRIMFTSHTDTVHMNSPHIHQTVILHEGMFSKDDNQPLGADDAAGNWIMFNMIAAKVPGIYAFFRGEERGGIGSSYCAKHHQELFTNVDCAIAFDRKGTSSIITHQGRGRGCSDEFGRSLARVINTQNPIWFEYKLDNTGIYTDTAEFFDIVDNCTNISVGYYNEHTKKETLDRGHIVRLKDALIAADWSKLDHTPPQPDPVPQRNALFSSVKMPADVADPLPWGSPAYDDGYDDDTFIGLQASDPMEVATYLFDNAEILPDDLRTEALLLSQEIFKRFE